MRDIHKVARSASSDAAHPLIRFNARTLPLLSRRIYPRRRIGER